VEGNGGGRPEEEEVEEEVVAVVAAGKGKEAEALALALALVDEEVEVEALAAEVGIAGAGDLTRVAGSVGGEVAAAPGVKRVDGLEVSAPTAPPASVFEDVEADEFLLLLFGGRVDGRAGGGSAREEEEVVEEVGESGRLIGGRRGRVAEEEGCVSSDRVTSPLLSSKSSPLS